MTQEQKKQALEIVNEEGLEVEDRGPYSGRSMYGRETQAVVGYPSDIEMLKSLMKHRYKVDLRIDSMGKNLILY